MKKLLFICQYYYPERIGLTDICEYLVKNEYDVTVLTGLPNYPEGKVPKEYKLFRKRKEIINGVKVKRCFEIGRRKGKVWLAINYISFLISSVFHAFFLGKKYDEVICYQHSPITMGVSAVLYKKLYKKALTLYCFDLWPESIKTYNIKESNIIFKIFKKISKFVYKNCNKILISSKPFEEYLVSNFNIDRNSISYLPQHSKDYTLDKKNKKKDNKIHFLFAGNIGKMQNIECIIKAANEIKKDDNFIVDIVGYGSNYDDLVELTKKLKLEDKILFHGQKKQDEMLEYYANADIMLLTLKGNTFVSKTLPLKLQSYMSTGKPILGSIEGAAEEVINESGCGICIKPDDYKLLAKKMSYLIKNKEVLKDMGKKSREYYDKNFDFDKLMEKFEKEL